MRGVYAAEAKVLGYSLTSPKKLVGIVGPQKGFGGDPLETKKLFEMTPEMKKRAKQYGIEGEIEKVARKFKIS